jgi:hypothetical protein
MIVWRVTMLMCGDAAENLPQLVVADMATLAGATDGLSHVTEKASSGIEFGAAVCIRKLHLSECKEHLSCSSRVALLTTEQLIRWAYNS